MENLLKYLPFLIPVLVLELTLMMTALIHVLKHHHYKFGNKAIWIIVVIFLSIIGPVLYFVAGKGEES